MQAQPATTAATVLHLARAGRFAQIRDMFVPQLRAMVTPETLQAGWEAGLREHSQVIATGAPVSEEAGPGVVSVRIPLTLERGEQTAVVSVSDGGWLVGIQLAPAGPAAAWGIDPGERATAGRARPVLAGPARL